MFKNILFYTICGLAKIPSVHTDSLIWTELYMMLFWTRIKTNFGQAWQKWQCVGCSTLCYTKLNKHHLFGPLLELEPECENVNKATRIAISSYNILFSCWGYLMISIPAQYHFGSLLVHLVQIWWLDRKPIRVLQGGRKIR